jgi:hypothetical protein
MQDMATYRPHSTVLPRFVDEGWARHFAGVAPTTIAHKVWIWALEDCTPSATTARDRVEALYLIRKPTQEEVGSGFWKKRVANQRSIHAAAAIPSQGVVFFHEQIFGSRFQDRITIVHPSCSCHTSVQGVYIRGCGDPTVDGGSEQLCENRIVGNKVGARRAEPQTCTAAQRLGNDAIIGEGGVEW